MTTKPTTAPTQAPVALNLRPRMWSTSSQVPMAAAAAMLVVRNAWTARALAPRALPPLNCRQGRQCTREGWHPQSQMRLCITQGTHNQFIEYAACPVLRVRLAGCRHCLQAAAATRQARHYSYTGVRTSPRTSQTTAGLYPAPHRAHWQAHGYPGWSHAQVDQGPGTRRQPGQRSRCSCAPQCHLGQQGKGHS
jgi:hypothetical protein